MSSTRFVGFMRAFVLLLLYSFCASDSEKDCLKMYPKSVCDKLFTKDVADCPCRGSDTFRSALDATKAVLRSAALTISHNPLIRNISNLQSWEAKVRVGEDAWKNLLELTKSPSDNELSLLLHAIMHNTTMTIDESSLPKFQISSSSDYVELSRQFAERRKAEASESARSAISANFVGQPLVVQRLETFALDAITGFRLKKGLQVYVFVGPPGTGKTYLGHLLAKDLRRSNTSTNICAIHLCTHFYRESSHLFLLDVLKMDMGNFKDMQDIDSFVGPRPGLVGEGHLFESLKDHPNSVVILDEIEKAHPTIISEFLLPVFSDGTLQVPMQ